MLELTLTLFMEELEYAHVRRLKKPPVPPEIMNGGILIESAIYGDLR